MSVKICSFFQFFCAVPDWKREPNRGRGECDQQRRGRLRGNAFRPVPQTHQIHKDRTPVVKYQVQLYHESFKECLFEQFVLLF